MINKLQAFLTKYYSESNVYEPYSIKGKAYIRFELGDKYPNGTKKRVKQATKRAYEIFKRVFPVSSSKLCFVFYEYEKEFCDPEGNFRNYLYSLIDPIAFDKFQTFPVKLKNGYVEIDANGNKLEEEVEVIIVIGELSQEEIDIEKMLNGIANLEMGFEPKVTQQVFVFDLSTHNGFYMYDDRGCLIWADKAEKIGEIFENYNSWIVEDYREEMEKFFK